MARKRPESFAIALDWLRADLRAGTHPAGARLTAGAIAERLQLSPTPVREALSHLAGEGLLDDRRGQGYAFRAPGTPRRKLTHRARHQISPRF